MYNKNLNLPVLELGMGFNSTPIIHWLSADKGRKAVSCESDQKWFESFADYGNANHTLRVVSDWTKERFEDTEWGVVLIDMRPALERHRQAIKLANSAKIVILHDTEPEIDRFYAYRRVWPHYKYRLDDVRFKPNTTMLSNFINLQEML